MEKSAHKLELLRRIADLEQKELWHLDVEDDPETYPLMPDQVDYLNEKLSSKIKNRIANVFGARFEKKAQLAGGVILILIGLRILLEHLGVIA